MTLGGGLIAIFAINFRGKDNKWRKIFAIFAITVKMAKIDGENGEIFSRHFAMTKIEKKKNKLQI